MEILISKLSTLIVVLSALTAVLTLFVLVDCAFLYRRIVVNQRKRNAVRG